MSAVKWHREQAARYAEQTREWEERGCSLRAGGYVDAIAHHALAADALEALAVPGVAELLYGLSGDRGYQPTDDQRAALATLARVAKEGR